MTAEWSFIRTSNPDAPLPKAGEGKSPWEEFRKVAFEDSLGTLVGFAKDSTTIYLADSADRDTTALYTLDLKHGKKELVAEDAKADLGGALAHPTEKNIQAVAFNYEPHRVEGDRQEHRPGHRQARRVGRRRRVERYRPLAG